MDKIRVISLGGLDEKYKDLQIVEINDDIFVVDCGLQFPDKTKPGIDYVIPKYDYLLANKNRIKAYFLTHGHDTLIGGLAYIYPSCPAPIYCSDICSTYFLSFLEHNHIDSSSFNIQIVDPNADLNIAGHQIHLVQVCCNMANCFAICFDTDQGRILICNNFVVDTNGDKGFLANTTRLGSLCEKPLLLLACESKYVKHPGYTSPKYKLIPRIEKQLNEAPGRLFFVIDAPDIYNTIKSIEYIVSKGRKIVVYDTDTRDVFLRLIKTGLVKIPKESLAHMEDVNRLPAKSLAIFINGFGNRLLHKLALIASKEHETQILTLNNTDTIVLGQYKTNENERVYSETMDELYRTDCHIICYNKNEFMKMRASEEDVRFLISVAKPKYYLPIDGTYEELLANAMLALNMNVGLKHNNIFVLENGMVVEFKDGIGRISDVKVPTGEIFIDGKGATNNLTGILGERQAISDEGIVILGVTISKSERKIVAGPDVQTRGLVYVKENDALLKDITKAFLLNVESYLAKENGSKAELENNIKTSVFGTIRRATLKSPIIVPIICEIE